MLNHLHIENFALIEDIDIDFYSNFNVILGETGSGKSILMDALSLLKGSKVEYEKIRFGKEKAFIEGVFSIDNPFLLKALKDKYIDYIEGNEFILSRTLLSQGKSIQRLNGHIVSLNVLKDLMKEMMDIYSQSDTPFYFDEKIHTYLLDHFKNLSSDEEKIYLDYQKAYQDYQDNEEKLDEIKKMIKLKEDEDYLAYQYEELNKADLKENEMEELEKKVSSLQNILTLVDKMKRFKEACETSLSSLYDAKKIVESIDEDLYKENKEAFIDAYYSLDESIDHMNELFSASLGEISEFDALKSRLTFLHSLKRKYGESTSDFIRKKEELKLLLEDLSDINIREEKLLKEKELLLKNVLDKGEILNDLRKKRSESLIQIFDEELKKLYFHNASLKVELNPCENFTMEGTYKARFLLRTNIGMNYLPLKDTASLGESSRIGLAFKKIFIEENQKETLIFDEIDIGLSGLASKYVGLEISEIAKNMQVLLITHLPQVAIYGNHFYLVEKEATFDNTLTHIRPLKDNEIYNEIAKMISGKNHDEESIQLVKSWLK